MGKVKKRLFLRHHRDNKKDHRDLPGRWLRQNHEIVRDEFGRHLEALVAEGRGDELADIQLLAEISSRTKKLPITFCAILHQGLSHYASGLPYMLCSNWKKD